MLSAQLLDFDQGKQFYAQGDYEKALNAFNCALQTDAKHVDAYINKGNTLGMLRRYEEALQTFNLALELKPNDIDALNGKISALIKLGRYKESLEICKKLMWQLMDEPEMMALVCTNAGYAHYKLGCYEESLRCYEGVLNLYPDSVNAQNGKRKALAKLTVPSDPDSKNATDIQVNLYAKKLAINYFKKGKQLYNQGLHLKSLTLLDRALELRPKFVAALTCKGYVLGTLNRYDDAREIFDKVLQLNPKSALAHNGRGSTLGKLGLCKEALNAYDEAIRLEPNYALAKSNRRQALRDVMNQTNPTEKIRIEHGYSSYSVVERKLARTRPTGNNIQTDNKREITLPVNDGLKNSKIINGDVIITITPPTAKAAIMDSKRDVALPADNDQKSTKITISPPSPAAVATDSKRDFTLSAATITVDDFKQLTHQLENAGLTVATLREFQQTLTLWGLEEKTESMRQLLTCHSQLQSIEARLETVTDLTSPMAEAKLEQKAIGNHPALLEYQNCLQQELARFFTAYWISTTGLLKLTDNKKGALLNAAADLPGAGIFLAVFVKGLKEVNEKNRFKQINRIAKVFKDTNHIADICQCVARRVTLAKTAEIKAQKVEERNTFRDKAAGYYQEAKEFIQIKSKGWKTHSSNAGITLTPAEKLAVLDGAFLLDQILEGRVKIDKAQDLVAEFIKILNLTSVTPAVSADIRPRKLNAAAPAAVHFKANTSEDAAPIAEEKGKKHEDRIKELEDQQKILKDELSRAKAKLSNLETFNDLISEITDECKVKTNENVVDTINLGFARLHARNQEERNFILERLAKQEEQLAEQRELINFLLLSQKSKRKSRNLFWQSTTDRRQQYAFTDVGASATNGAGPGPGNIKAAGL